MWYNCGLSRIKNCLIKILGDLGLSHKFISLIKSMYEDIKMAVKLPGGLTTPFLTYIGGWKNQPHTKGYITYWKGNIGICNVLTLLPRP